MSSILDDLRLSTRRLRRSPGFALVAILTLALGIGANTAILSVANAVLLRALPYRDARTLVTIAVDGAVPAPLFAALRDRSRAIHEAALFASWTANLAGEGEPQQIPGARVSANLFALLGVHPQLGSAFHTDDDRDLVIGDGLWKRAFGGDRHIVGRTVTVDGAPYTIVGVMPPGFAFPNGPELPVTVGPFPPAEIWRPIALSPGERTCGGCFNFGMLARLAPGMTPRSALPDLDAIAHQTLSSHDARRLTQVRGLQDAVTARVRTPILVLWGAVTMALLIACLNVANLLLARGVRRQHEVALRYSLGATRARVVSDGLAEAAVLAIAAAAVAAPLAALGS
jgi:putative ABC transport system permease protein